MSTTLRHLAIFLICSGVTIISFVSFANHPHATMTFIQSIAVLVTGLYVYSKDSNLRLNTAFMLLCCTFFCYLISVYLLHIATQIGMEKVENTVWITRNGLILLPAALTHFIYIFLNEKSRFLTIAKWVSLATCLPLVILNLCNMYVTEYRLIPHTYVPAGELTAYQFSGLTVVFWNVFCAVMVIIYALHEGRYSLVRNQRLLFLGSWFLGFFYAILGYLPAFNKNYFPAYIGVVWSIFPICISIGILKFTLFDIKIALRRTLPYAIGIAMIGCSYILFLNVAGTLLQTPFDSMPELNLVILLLMTGIFFQPITENFRLMLDRLLFRHEDEMNESLANLGKELTLSKDMEDVAEKIINAINTSIAPTKACLIVEDRQNAQNIDTTNGLSEKIFSISNWDEIMSLPRFCDFNRISPQQETLNKQWFSIMQSAGYKATITMHNQAIRGIILIGEKKSHLLFSRHDITFLQSVTNQAEMAFERLHEKLQANKAISLATALTETAPILAAIIDSNGVIENCNSRFRLVFSPAANASLPELGLGELRQMEAQEKPRDITALNRHYLAHKNRLHAWEEDTRELVILSDVTEFKQMQEISHKQKILAELGVMVSSINHEFDNILSPISYSLERLCQSSSESNVQHEKHSQRLNEGFKRLRILTTELKQVYKDPVLEPRMTDVNKIAQSVTTDLRTQFQSTNNIWTEPQLPEPGTEICADPQKFRQILHNLMKNAFQSMESAQSSGKWGVRIHRENSHIQISVFDSGTGIEQAHKDKIFEPFFSTKGTHGTGLGMVIVRRIAEAHGASIGIKSQPGEGTTITLLWPNSEKSICASATTRSENPANTSPNPASLPY